MGTIGYNYIHAPSIHLSMYVSLRILQDKALSFFPKISLCCGVLSCNMINLVTILKSKIFINAYENFMSRGIRHPLQKISPGVNLYPTSLIFLPSKKKLGKQSENLDAPADSLKACNKNV